MSSTEIILYDIPRPAATADDRAWAPNPKKIRYALHYKGLQYRTVWIEYPDIEPFSKKIGVSPSGVKPDGRPLYTLPVIHDLSTGVILAESFAIAQYLDATYPALPTLLPQQSTAFQAMFPWFFDQYLLEPIRPLMLVGTWQKLGPRSQVYFRQAREARFGCTLEEVCPPGAQRVAQCEQVKAAFGRLAGWMDTNGAAKPFFMGETPSFADFVIAGFLTWMKKGLDAEEFATFLTWHEGRWAAIFAGLSAYEAIDVGAFYVPE